jgi:formyl-CoA transferase
VGTAAMPKYHLQEWPNPVAGARYKTRDGRYIMIVELNPENIARLPEAFGADQLAGDERFATPQARLKHHRAILDELQKVVGELDLDTVKARLKRFGVNFSVAQTTQECTRDEHMIANGCFPEVEGAEGIRTVDSPMNIHSEGVEKTRPQAPPNVGEHTAQVLASSGYSDESIEALAAAGAVGLPK